MAADTTDTSPGALIPCIPEASELRLASVAKLVEAAADYAQASKAARTRDAYRRDWLAYEEWCASVGAQALPITTEKACVYLAHLATKHKLASIKRYMAALKAGNAAAGHPTFDLDPRYRDVMRGIRRTLGAAQIKKAPVLPEDLRRMVAATPSQRLKDKRDRALLLLGFASALRRLELVSVQISHLAADRHGYRLLLPRSKTDQEGQGRTIGIPYGSSPHTCPVRAIQDWLEACERTSGALFVSIDRHGNLGERLGGSAVAVIVKEACVRAGLDPAPYAGHSLRSGLVTAAAKAGKPVDVIMRQTGHTNVATMIGYIRDADLFEDNAASGIGL